MNRAERDGTGDKSSGRRMMHDNHCGLTTYWSDLSSRAGQLAQAGLACGCWRDRLACSLGSGHRLVLSVSVGKEYCSNCCDRHQDSNDQGNDHGCIAHDVDQAILIHATSIHAFGVIASALVHC